jgi:hypothetical protein
MTEGSHKAHTTTLDVTSTILMQSKRFATQHTCTSCHACILCHLIMKACSCHMQDRCSNPAATCTQQPEVERTIAPCMQAPCVKQDTCTKSLTTACQQLVVSSTCTFPCIFCRDWECALCCQPKQQLCVYRPQGERTKHTRSKSAQKCHVVTQARGE